MHRSDSEVKRYTLIVAAAGVGKRMNLGYPKQFLEYKDKPLFIQALEVGEACDLVTEIIVVTSEDLVEKVKSLCNDYNISKVTHVIKGGAERQDSIYNALEYAHEDSYIAVQDGVRPFMKGDYLRDAYNLLEEDSSINGIVIGVPSKDTIKIVDERGFITSTPNRRFVYMAHTPQVFRGRILKEAYEKAKEDKFIGTDDSSLVERYFGKVKIMVGEYDNIKITTIEDIKFLKD